MELSKLDNYIQKGGNVLLAINRVNGNLQNAYGSSLYTGLSDWLKTKGVQLDDKFIIDSKCANVTVQRQQGSFRIQSQVQFPYLPIINNFADHPISKGLEAVILPFASPVSFTGDTTMNYQPLAYTSKQAGTVSVPTYFDVQRQ